MHLMESLIILKGRNYKTIIKHRAIIARDDIPPQIREAPF